MPQNTFTTLALGVALLLLTVAGLHYGFTVRAILKLRFRRSKAISVLRDTIPEEELRILNHARAPLNALGFRYIYTNTCRQGLVLPGKTFVYIDCYEHPALHAYAMVVPSVQGAAGAPYVVSFLTCFKDGLNLETQNNCKHFMVGPLPDWEIHDDYLPSLALQWSAHQKRVAAADRALEGDGIEAYKRIQWISHAMVDYWTANKYLVPTKQKRWRVTLPTALAMAVRFSVGQWRARRHNALSGEADVHGQTQQNIDGFLQRLAFQRETPNAPSRLRPWLMLLGSAVAFVVLAGFMGGWLIGSLLLAIVALHEGGHWLAMRLAGYQNTRVFFLPGLGGVATGQKANATPMQKLIVYAAGPLPGIVLSLAAVYWVNAEHWQAAWLAQLVLLLFVINYFNLLPVNPLDGGKIIDLLIFSSVPILRLAFALLSLVALVWVAVLLDSTVFWVLAGLMLIAFPTQWRFYKTERILQRTQTGPPVALSEPDAVARVFQAMAGANHQWSFEQRVGIAAQLYPELMSRPLGRSGALIGTLAYLGLVIGIPAGLAFLPNAHDQPMLPALMAVIKQEASKGNATGAPSKRSQQQQLEDEKAAQLTFAKELAELESRLKPKLDAVATAPAAQRLPVLLMAIEQYQDLGSMAPPNRLKPLRADALATAQMLPAGDLTRAAALVALASEESDLALVNLWLRATISELRVAPTPATDADRSSMATTMAAALAQLGQIDSQAASAPPAKQAERLREVLYWRQQSTADGAVALASFDAIRLARAQTSNGQLGIAEQTLRDALAFTTSKQPIAYSQPEKRVRASLARLLILANKPLEAEALLLAAAANNLPAHTFFADDLRVLGWAQLLQGTPAAAEKAKLTFARATDAQNRVSAQKKLSASIEQAAIDALLEKHLRLPGGQTAKAFKALNLAQQTWFCQPVGDGKKLFATTVSDRDWPEIEWQLAYRTVLNELNVCPSQPN